MGQGRATTSPPSPASMSSWGSAMGKAPACCGMSSRAHPGSVILGLTGTPICPPAGLSQSTRANCLLISRSRVRIPAGSPSFQRLTTRIAGLLITCPHNVRKMPADLTDTDLATIVKLLRETIAADRFPLSPRVRRWQAILEKIEPPAPRPELPPLKPSGTPSMLMAMKRRRRRQVTDRFGG
jgi:hypothetical protein